MLVTSAYAIAEAERNLDRVDSRTRLYRLLQQIEIADEAPTTASLPKDVHFATRDRPILLAAIHAKCSDVAPVTLDQASLLQRARVRVVEGARLESVCRGTLPWVRIPPSPPFSLSRFSSVNDTHA